MAPDRFQDAGPLHHPAPENDSPRRKGHDDVHNPVRQGQAYLLPSGGIGGEHGGFLDAPALRDGRSADKPFQTGNVERTLAREIDDAGRLRSRHHEVPDFRMEQPMQRLPVHQDSATHSRPDGEVDQRIDPLSRPRRCSPKAAALTSVSNPTGTPKRSRIRATKGTFCHPGLGVVVMQP